MSIAHVVTFTFEPGTPTDVFTLLSSALDALVATCDGVESFIHGPDLKLRVGTADYAIAGVFRDVEALHAYLTAPGHLRLLQDFGGDLLGKSSAQFLVSQRHQGFDRARMVSLEPLDQ